MFGAGLPIADAVSVAVAAQLVTAPLIAAISGRFSLVAVLANLVVAPVVAPVTVLGTAAAALCVVAPGVAGLLIRLPVPKCGGCCGWPMSQRVCLWQSCRCRQEWPDS